ncbi:hypothetical protein F5Y06DRAFT_295964 [Hypoxylon sp. FL0890]|nr:hypothetical protein F5Y06DRAFT_295964 [Hypoxylon sp. FL0890]
MPRLKDIVWVEGMKTPRGLRHTEDFATLIHASRRKGPEYGTVEDPSVTWIHFVPRSREVVTATERIVKEQASRFGMPYVWVMMMGHGISTVRKTARGRTFSHDDHHVTIRMGTSPNICNLHGHLYLIYEDRTPDVIKEEDKILVPIRMMTEQERSVVGGKNPQLWVWGGYPDPSPEYPRAPFDYPKTPYEVKPGSILDKYAFRSS